MVLRVEEISVNRCFNVTYDFDRVGNVDVNPPTASRRKGETCPFPDRVGNVGVSAPTADRQTQAVPVLESGIAT